MNVTNEVRQHRFLVIDKSN